MAVKYTAKMWVGKQKLRLVVAVCAWLAPAGNEHRLRAGQAVVEAQVLGAGRRGVEWTHNLAAPEFADATAICGLLSPMEGLEMDWKRLVQFALLGSSDLEQYAALLVRVSLGLFFAISGANKLFVSGNRQIMYETLVKAKVPFPRQMAYFVASVEFVGGSLLAVGFVSSLACVALLADMLVAILTARLPAMSKRLLPLNWFEDFLYLPEVLYVLIFFWLICSGPGKFSVDYWLACKLLK